MHPHFSKIAPGMTGYYAVPLRTIALEKLYAMSTPNKPIFTLSQSPTPPRMAARLWPTPPVHAGPPQATSTRPPGRRASWSQRGTLRGDQKLNDDFYAPSTLTE